jgi:hypothetical protein
MLKISDGKAGRYNEARTRMPTKIRASKSKTHKVNWHRIGFFYSLFQRCNGCYLESAYTFTKD